MKSLLLPSRTRSLFAGSIMIFLVGCGGGGGSAIDAPPVGSQPSPPPIEPPATHTNAQQMWRGSGIKTYQFTYNRKCFCPPQALAEMVITVRNETVESAVFAATGASAPSLQGLPTVGELFAVIEDAYQKNASTINVQYNAVQGYPELIEIDYIKNAFDDEQGYRVSKLKTL